MKFLSLFSGAGGFDIGLESAGWESVFQCEIDKNCQEVLKYRWPNIPKWGDISTLTGKHILENCGEVDAVAWGSPCQDLSVAGVRAGLEGNRSNLFYEGIRIIKELRELSDGKYPKWSIWENVPGALSSNKGRDFRQVLWEMDEAGAYFSEWAVLDARYFGVPQRRKRVFLASCFDYRIAQECREPLFPVAKSSAGDTEEIFKKREGIAGVVVSKTRGTGKTVESELCSDDILSFDTQFGSNANVFKNIAPTLKSSQQPPTILFDGVLRKLTPNECERLMGWDDDHTLYRADGKKSSKTVRYSMCGNGVASPVAKWIGEQIMEAC